MKTPDELRAHARELARAFKIRLRETVPPDRPELATYLYGERTNPITGTVIRVSIVRCAPITSEETYAPALHEMGHALAPLGLIPEARKMGNRPNTLREVRLAVEQEYAAWEWAKHYAIEWTPTMEHVRTICFSTYRRSLAQFTKQREQIAKHYGITLAELERNIERGIREQELRGRLNRPNKK